MDLPVRVIFLKGQFRLQLINRLNYLALHRDADSQIVCLQKVQYGVWDRGRKIWATSRNQHCMDFPESFLKGQRCIARMYGLDQWGVQKCIIWSCEYYEIGWIIVRQYDLVRRKGEKEWTNRKGCGKLLVGLY